MTKLVVVESPAKAKTINKYLGKDYQVLASFGHICDLPAKNGSVRPEEDFAMDYEVSPGSSKHVQAMAEAVKKSEAIYLATDPDREGEAISWHIVEILRKKRAIKKDFPIRRVAFHEITKRAVTEAIENPRDIDMDLVNAQQARRALDYLVGFNLSPVLWRKLPGSRSAGRVQSVALRLVCDREEEITRFIPREYWDITIGVATDKKEKFSAKVTHVDGNKLEQFDLENEVQAKALEKRVQSKQYAVGKIERKQVRRNPKPPFTTSSLQQEASRKLGFGAKRTMQVAQKLYEGIDLGGDTVGLITYMRTDAVTVSQEAVSGTRDYIGKRYGDNYLPKSARSYQTKAKNSQEAHEAIRPTDVTKAPSEVAKYLDKDQLKLYELIWKRMVASQMESVVLDQVAVPVVSEDKEITARATGSTIAFDGFYTLYREGVDDANDEDDDKRLPALQDDQALALEEVLPEQHFTQPPPRFTEASLVKKLEELGIGRPSTYASIISVLLDRDYVRLDKKRFIAEDRGRVVTAFLTSFFQRYVEFDFTANLEEELDQVSDGQLDWKVLLRNFWQPFSSNIEDVQQYSGTDVIRELNLLLGDLIYPKDAEGNVDRTCPSCDDGRLSIKLGKFGAFIGCSNYPDCRHTKQLTSEQNGEDSDADAEQWPKLLGNDPDTGKEISVRKGPYGFYIQLETEDEKKPKRVALPKGYQPAEVTLEQAIDLLRLPREVGIHPDTGKKITASIGRFGPYLYHASKYTSLKEDDVLTVGINRAVALIAENNKASSNEPLRVIGKHPEDEKDVAVYSGRYGPYVKHGKLNASLGKDLEVETISLEEALQLLDKQAKKKASKKKKKS
jgi:DNA topoisomerase-1